MYLFLTLLLAMAICSAISICVNYFIDRQNIKQATEEAARKNEIATKLLNEGNLEAIINSNDSETLSMYYYNKRTKEKVAEAKIKSSIGISQSIRNKEKITI